MKYFEFTPFAMSSVKVRFDCIRCGTEVESDDIEIPSPNYEADTASDSQVSDDSEVHCENCDKEYSIDIHVTYSGGLGSIAELPDFYYVEVEETEDPREFEDENDYEEIEQDNPDLDAAAVLQILQDRGAGLLHHANTVTTSHTFIRFGELLSRGATERLNLRMTSQRSDTIDKEHDIWNFIFLDTVDIHNRTRNFNFYGPVMFVLNTDAILGICNNPVRVTKKNPTKWTATDTIRDRYFTSIDELLIDLKIGQFDNMIMLTGNNGQLSLQGNVLSSIKLDDPKVEWTGGDNVFKTALDYLEAGKAHSGIQADIEPRGHVSACGCTDSYRDMYDRSFQRLFLPNCRQ
jgi:DNA-directed RNA polymerase subunit RPC12/RpoP